MTVTIHDGCHFFNNVSNLFQVFSESLVIQVKGPDHLFRQNNNVSLHKNSSHEILTISCQLPDFCNNNVFLCAKYQIW